MNDAELEQMIQRIKELNAKGPYNITEDELVELRRLLQATDERREFGICAGCQRPFEFGDEAIEITTIKMGSSQGHPCAYDNYVGRYHQNCFLKILTRFELIDKVNYV